MERKVPAAGETSRKQCMLPGRVRWQVDSACSKVQRRAGVHQWAEEWQVHCLRGPQESLCHQTYCGMNMELSKGSFFSLPEGIQRYLWGGELCTAIQQSCGTHTKSDESKTWIHLRWFLGINDYSWKYFLELQNSRLLVFCKVSKGDPNTRWNHDGDFPVFSLRESDRAGRFSTCSFLLPGLVACAETHPLKKLLIWCLRVFSIVHFCRSALFNECEQNLSADTNTWIQVHKLERILHPMKRRWPVMQHVWDLHQIWFIRVFSSHSFFPD